MSFLVAPIRTENRNSDPVKSARAKAKVEEELQVQQQAAQPAASSAAPAVRQAPKGLAAGMLFQDRLTQNRANDALAEVRKPAAQKLKEAQTVYDAYIQSDEYKQNLAAADQKARTDWWMTAAITGSSDTIMQPIKDQKEQELRAMVDHYTAQVQQEEGQAVMNADLKELEEWDEADRAALETYIQNRNTDFANSMNPMLDTGFGTATMGASGLIQKYGLQRVNEMAESLTRSRNAQTAQQADQAGRDGVNSGTMGALEHNALSIPASAIGGMTGLFSYLQELGERSGRYPTMDPNSIGNLPSVYSGAVREETAGNIAESIDGPGGKIASLGYQGLMSMADSYARMLMGGGSFGGAALAATNTFSQTMSEASAQGATPGQAALLATTKAGIEALSEKIPLDNLIDTAKVGGRDLTNILIDAFAQAGVEITTEEISLFGSVLADAAIMREKSAYKDASWEDLMWEAAETAIVSGISGGASSAGASVVGNVMAPAAKQQQNPKSTADNAAPVKGEPEAAITPEEAAEQLGRESPKAEPVQKTEGELGIDRAYEATVGNVQKPAEQLTPQERGNRYKASKVNTAILDLVDRVKRGLTKGSEKVNLGTVSDANASQIQRETGIDTRGYSVAIEARQIEHILKDHGENGRSNQSMANPEDIARIEYALSNPDRISKSDPTKAYVTNRDGKMKPADTVLYETRLEDGSYYVVQAVPETKKRTLYVLSAFIGKSDYKNEAPQSTNTVDPGATPEAESTVTPEGTTQSTNTNSPGATSETDSAGASTDSVPQNGPEVNGNIDESRAQGVDGKEQSVEGGQGRKDTDTSRTFTNTGLRNADADVRSGYREYMRESPDAAEYKVKHRDDTLATAKGRVSDPEKAAAEYDYLMEKGSWDADDVATSNLLQGEILRSGDPDAQEKFRKLSQKKKAIAVALGQATDAFRIQDGTMQAAKNTATAVDHVIDGLDKMEQKDTIYRKRKDGPTFEEWKKNIGDEVTNLGIAVAMVEDGDVKQMRDVIQQIAKHRGTTAWFGISGKMTAVSRRALNKLDFDTLKTVANSQIAAMADDYRARKPMEVAGNVRKMNMLQSLKTVERNIAGNGSIGFLDSLSDSGAGHMVDNLLAKITGKRTIGNDLFHSSEYMRAAKEAMEFASLCVELNIPIETDAEASLGAAMGGDGKGKYVGKTFRAKGNPAMRAMYAVQKYMSYALEVSDKIFEGGTNAAVAASLENLKNANLSQEEIQRLSDYAGNRRTFKDATWKDQDGTVHGSKLSRKADSLTQELGVFGEIVSPFVKVPMNVAQAGIDYTTGIAKSVGEIASLIADAKAGKEIAPERQRQAASDFGRGLTGTVMIAVATAAAGAGIIRVTEDDDLDKEALALAEGRSGAQINWSRLERWLKGDENTGWESADMVSDLDFLEPFNTQLYLGYELAQEESFLEMLKAYPGANAKSVLKSLMDSPVMTGLAEIEELLGELSEAEGLQDIENAAAGYAGDVASSFIPQYVRQYAQYTDGYYRDTTGATPAEAALNKVKAALPKLSQELPIKYSGLGEPQKRGGFLNTFLDPTDTHGYNQNPVTTYLDELSAKTGDNSIYPDRQAPKSITVDDEEILIDGKEMTEKYQKTYGDNINAMYAALMREQGFNQLPEDQQIDAFKKAKEYATKLAKAAVSDYDEDLPEGDTSDMVKDIMFKTRKSGFNEALLDLADAWDEEEDPAEAIAELDRVYEEFKANVPADKRGWFAEEAGGGIKDYITARKCGVDATQFADLYRQYKDIGERSDLSEIQKAEEWASVLQHEKEAGRLKAATVANLKKEMGFYITFQQEATKYNQMVDDGMTADNADLITQLLDGITGTGKIDKETGEKKILNRDNWRAIAKSGLKDDQLDIAMKAYMDDYDPNAESPDKTELRYDYARQELGLTAEEYVKVITVQQEGGEKAEKIADWRELGFTAQEANMFYRLFAATGRTKIDVEAWAEELYG